MERPLNRPMDARQWGNPAAIAGQAFCLDLVSRFTGARSLISLVSSGSGQQCTGIRPMSYGRHRLRDASSHSLMRVDAVRAMRTGAWSFFVAEYDQANECMTSLSIQAHQKETDTPNPEISPKQTKPSL